MKLTLVKIIILGLRLLLNKLLFCSFTRQYSYFVPTSVLVPSTARAHYYLLHPSYWHCPHSRRSRVCETVQCPSVCPPACLSQHGHTAVNPRPGGKRYRSIATAAAGECGQCHVVSVRRNRFVVFFSRTKKYQTNFHYVCSFIIQSCLAMLHACVILSC